MNILFDKIILVIQGIEKFYKSKSGAEKKAMAIKYITNWLSKKQYDMHPDVYNMYNDFVENYLDSIIDLLVFVAKNKKLYKLFKKSCGCLNFKKAKESEQIIDDLLK